MNIRGKYGEAKVFASDIEEDCTLQIERLLDQDFIEGSKIRIMPDVHQGIGCVIGFTADMKDKVIPNIVGVDIGCGILTVKLGKVYPDLPKLDKIIKENIPAGFNVFPSKQVKFEKLKDLYCYRELENIKRIERSIGTLGGGNHFIEVAEDSKGDKYLIIHTGSRNLGKQVADYYQALAVDLCSGKEEFFDKKEKIIREYKEQGRRSEIKKALIELEKQYEGLEPKYPKDICFLTGKYREAYLHDMKICQEYASLNRKTIGDIILKKATGREVEDYEYFETTHNYIDFEDNIIRKGAVSAKLGEEILIPINMRDGSILAIGKGNKDWNESAPHGAGRLLSRKQAKKRHSLDRFIKDMEGIYTTSVNERTLDENPRAYKPMKTILEFLDETAELVDILKPIYNFKGV